MPSCPVPAAAAAGLLGTVPPGRPSQPSGATSRAAAASAELSTPAQVDQMLGAVATDVRLATDGQRRTMIRFEVSEGELRGTRIAVTSDGGTISAVLVPPAEVTFPVALESALESVRGSLEGRGIVVADLEVRPDDGRGGSPSGREAPEGATSDDPPVARAPSRPPRQEVAEGVDYFV